MEKKNLYESPVMEIEDWVTDDILTTSCGRVDIITDDQNTNEDVGYTDIF